MVRVALLMASVWWIIEGFEIVGNYKFWDSVSGSLIYDHSGMKNHGSYNSQNFYFTDRGITFYDSTALIIPYIGTQYPGYMDFMVSYWYLRKNDNYTRAYTMTFNNYNIMVFFQIISQDLQITVLDALVAPTFTFSQTILSLNLTNRWSLYTFKVTQNASNTDSNITIYIDLNSICTFLVPGASLSSTSFFRIGAANYLYGILYEIWWHKDVSDIRELDYLSSSNCVCSYGCVTSPVVKCLPDYDATYNYEGQICSPLCLESCNSDFECIENSKDMCHYGLYHLESGNCLVYCPDDSCIITATLSCKEGFKIASENPPACIPAQCINYERNDYRYTCYQCELGYRPDTIGEYCICDTGYTAVSSDPIICIRIENCLSYMKVEDEYICTSCSEGYSIDSEGSCNECNADYIQVLEEPFTCILEIDNCVTYKVNDDLIWECELCKEGYSLTLDNVCTEDPDSALEEVCESNYYLSDGLCSICPDNCNICDILDDKIQCITCKQTFTLIVINDDERVCIQCSIDNPACNSDPNNHDESDSDNSSEENIDSSSNSDSESDDSTLEAIRNRIETGTIVITSISLTIVCLNSIISLDANDFLRYMNDVKLLSYIILLSVALPYEVQVEKKSNLKTIKKLNILSYIQIRNENIKDVINDFIYDGYGFISRIPYELLGFMIILLLNMLIYLFKRFGKGKLKALGDKGVQYFTYTAYIQFFMLMYLDISYYAISKLLHVINT